MLKSHELIGFMPPTLAAEILAFTFESEKPTYKATLAAVAQARKLRPVYLERQPRSQRDATILATLTRPSQDATAGGLIRTWLLKKHKAVLVDFLDALGISHNDGVVDSLPETMDDTKLKAAVEGLLAKYPPEVVAIYLNAFDDMNEVSWPNLATLLKEDKRLQFGG